MKIIWFKNSQKSIFKENFFVFDKEIPGRGRDLPRVDSENLEQKALETKKESSNKTRDLGRNIGVDDLIEVKKFTANDSAKEKLKQAGLDVDLKVDARFVKWKLRFKVGNQILESERSLRKTGKLLRALSEKDQNGKLIYDTPDKVKLFLYNYLFEKITKDGSIKSNRWKVKNFDASNDFLLSEISRLNIITESKAAVPKKLVIKPYVSPFDNVSWDDGAPLAEVKKPAAPVAVERERPRKITEEIQPAATKIEFTQKVLSPSESPTGLPLYINTSSNPELAKKEPRYITYWHGDYGSIDKTLKTGILANVESLRKSGINAILLIPEYDPSKGMEQSWKSYREKFDNLVDYCSQKYGGGRFDFTAFSGGYRGVAAVLQFSRNANKIASINLLDAAFPDSDDPIKKLFIEYIRNGGRGRVVTGNILRSKKEGEKINEALTADVGNGEFEFIESNMDHYKEINKNYMASAIAYAGQPSGEFAPRKDIGREVMPAREIALRSPVKAEMRVLANAVSGEALSLISRVNIDAEDYVAFTNTGRYKKFKLKESPYRCLELAKKFAQADGYDIFVTSGHRSHSEQEELYGKSDGSGIKTAAPGESWHQKGAAVDCVLKDSDGRRLDDADSKKRLEGYMNKAGFVRYDPEWWHFEVGSKGWLKIMEKAGYLGSLAKND